MSSKKGFSSEGFDLDAVPELGGKGSNGNSYDDVVFELGGGASAAIAEQQEKDRLNEEEKANPTMRSEELKAEGNELFKAGNYLDAYDMYTDAIEACPGLTGSEILKLRDEFEEQEREKAYERHRIDEERNRHRRMQQHEEGDAVSPETSQASKSDTQGTEESNKQAQFVPPLHEHGSKLAIYHCNRAACLLHLGRYGEAISDCDIAILLNPAYVKALLRRMTAHENIGQTEEALQDAKRALELDPMNSSARQNAVRLQKIEDERLEKLKEETMGKLKDLGNSILGNFGLSLDNFKAEKDANTGSYSISFDQNNA